MLKSLTPKRALVLIATVGVAVTAAGCGTSNPDIPRGRVLFIQNCASCHVFAEAGSTGKVGPDLDSAFAAARASGMDADTIEGVVKAQVEYPRPSTDNPAISMPADLVTGTALDDVAAYVARYAGVPGAAPPKVPGGPGAQVFANNGCAGCHTLKEADAGGTTGPNLDEVLPGQSAAMIQEDIVDPNATLAKGYGPNIMPQNYEQLIPAMDLDQLVQFLIEATGGGGANTGASAAGGAGGAGGAKKSGAKEKDQGKQTTGAKKGSGG
jgi:cytochrome c2